MKRFIRRKIEAWLILVAAKILEGRTVHRSPVVFRHHLFDLEMMGDVAVFDRQLSTVDSTSR